MEDAHTIILDFATPATSFVAVYDGHGGRDVANFSARELHALLREHDGLSSDPEAALRETFLKVDEKLRSSDLQTDLMGTTAAVALISDKEVIAAGVGDTRVILAADGKSHALTNDHKPNVSSERNRIESAGGIVIFGRTNGTLAISRALGDFAMKSLEYKPEAQCVTADPDTRKHVGDTTDFVLVACDGVWDVLSNDKAVAFVYEQLEKRMDPEEIIIRLAAECVVSRDNVTAVLAVSKTRYPWLAAGEFTKVELPSAYECVTAALSDSLSGPFVLPSVPASCLPATAADGDVTADDASAWASVPPPIPEDAGGYP